MKSKNKIPWLPAFKKLFKEYKGKKHPLKHENWYQLIVMVVLSAQTTDDNVNKSASNLFKKFPTIQKLAAAYPEDVYPFISSLRSFVKKADWIVRIAKELEGVTTPPLVIQELIRLPGIGSKSANVIISELGGDMQGIIVDLHVLRVAERLGISSLKDNPEKVEKKLMEIIPQEYWRDAGMSLTFWGREKCRPTDPNCPKCAMKNVCAYELKQK